MSLRIETAVIAPQALAREGLASLLERYSYKIIGSAPDAAHLIADLAVESPKIVLLGAEQHEDIMAQSAACRRRWPKSTIVILHDGPAAISTHMILQADADACLPSSVSHETLLKSLELVVGDEQVVLLLLDRRRQSEQLAERSKATNGRNSVENTDARPNAGSNIGAKGEVKVLVSNGEQVPLAPDHGSKSRNQPKLSERELSILDGIVRGYQNKMIARACGITEATVKVHMKSILRKIRVGNRTQAAVWALENNLSICDGLESRIEQAEHDSMSYESP